MSFSSPLRGSFSASHGITLIEVLTVIALVSMLALWVLSSGREIYRDYQIRAAIEKSQQRLALMEVIRRSGMSGSGAGQSVSDLSTALWAAGMDDLENLTSLLITNSPLEEVFVAAPDYAIDDGRTTVSVHFNSGDVAWLDMNAMDRIVSDDGLVTTLRFYSRDTDPLIHTYTADAFHGKRRPRL